MTELGVLLIGWFLLCPAAAVVIGRMLARTDGTAGTPELVYVGTNRNPSVDKFPPARTAVPTGQRTSNATG
jgi:hypothetical protein